jgi:hypothetical protein
MSPLFADHLEDILVLIVYDEVHGSLFDLRGGLYIAPKIGKDMVYFAWGKGAEDDLLGPN